MFLLGFILSARSDSLRFGCRISVCVNIPAPFLDIIDESDVHECWMKRPFIGIFLSFLIHFMFIMRDVIKQNESELASIDF